MKKAYIIPKVKVISMDPEASIMLTGSINPDETVDGGDAMSNRREGTNTQLWGDREW